MPAKKQKKIAILPDKGLKNIPSFKPFYENLPPLPQVDLPLSKLFIAFDRQLVYTSRPAGFQTVISKVERLLDRQFGVRKLIEAGSVPTCTGIQGHCDLDYLVCLRYSSVATDSSEMLTETYDCLRRGFGACVRQDSPAIIIRFGELIAEQLDIVPIFNMRDQDYLAEIGYPDYIPPSPMEQFHLPGFSGEWLPTNPVHHIHSIENADVKQEGRMRRLIRLLKAWKYGNDIPIISYYLESFVLHLAREEHFSDYPQLDLFKIFNCIKYICNKPDVSIVDPNIYSNWGRIVPCRCEDIPRVKSAIQQAAYEATLALDFEWRGNVNGARDIWSNIFHQQIS